MTRTRSSLCSIGACAVALLGLGCEDKLPGVGIGHAPSDAGARHAFDAGTRPARETVDLSGLSDFDIRFELRAGGKPFDCSSAAVELGAAKTAMTLQDARLFVSDVRALSANGEEHTVVLKPDDIYQQSTVALLDFEDATSGCETGTAATHTVLHGAVEPGAYEGLAFHIGVPEALDHEDPGLAWPPLDVLSMHWGWSEGYRFLRLDLLTPDDQPLEVHLGSADCSVGAHDAVSCADDNRPAVELHAFDAATDAVVLDLDVLLAGWDITQETPDCIAGALPAACPPIFDTLGLDSETGASRADRQTAFVAAPR